MVITSAGDREDRELVFNGYRVPVLPDEEFWRGMVGLGAQECERT